MPRNQDNCRSNYSKYDSMTTEELEDLLRQDAQNLEGDTDVALLMYITEVIRKRKEPKPEQKTPEEAFEIFKNNYMPTDLKMEAAVDCIGNLPGRQRSQTKVRTLPRWMRRLVAAAAVVALLFAGNTAAHALGYDLWDTFIQWTQETFHFSRGNGQEYAAPVKGNQDAYQSLQDALDAYSISTPLAPKWIPEGYELSEIKVNASPIQEVFLAIYSNGDQKLKVQVKRYLGTDPEQIEQSGTLIEEYISNNITFHILEDNRQFRAAWIVEDYECYISGELTVDEMKEMIDSIKE